MTARSMVTFVACATLAAGAGRALGQAHGVEIASMCESPTCIGEPLACQITIAHNDDFGDTIELSAAHFYIDPAGRALRDPPVGDLPARLFGNAVALGPDGGLPIRIGPAGSTLSGLPGVEVRGEVHFGPGEYVAASSDTNPLFVKAFVLASDLCDDPDTEGCFTFPNTVQFTAATLLGGNFDVSLATDPLVAPGSEHVATVDVDAAIVDTIEWSIDGGHITSGQGTDTITLVADASAVALEVAVTDDSGCTVTDAVTLRVGAPDIDGDGVVGPDDLAAVVDGWGVCPVPPGSCLADVNGDGTVNVDDLVFVIVYWS